VSVSQFTFDLGAAHQTIFLGLKSPPPLACCSNSNLDEATKKGACGGLPSRACFARSGPRGDTGRQARAVTTPGDVRLAVRAADVTRQLSMEHEGIVHKLCPRQVLCVHHKLVRFNPLTYRGGAICSTNTIIARLKPHACRTSNVAKDPDDCRNNVKNNGRRIWLGKQESSKAGYIRTSC
jgi:hypothetical protein